jgi:hypothetical protein
MVVILSTVITCSQAISLINRMANVPGLTPQQKLEIIKEVRKVVPSCPVTIQKDATKQTSASS